jgi:N-acylglucosamine 2-epimerase
MWFMIHIYRQSGNQKLIRQAIDCIRWHIELGWDTECGGGILLARDAEGSFWADKWDTKIWWPHTEALYALLLAYSITHEHWCLEWLKKVHDYAFTHFPVPRYGEWYQRFDRYGKKINNIAAMPVKDPYHLARSLIYCTGVLKQLSSTGRS